MAAAAKTPTVAIARVLRAFALKQGEDFRVAGHRNKGERIGTFVKIVSDRAQQLIADNADAIESMAGELGFAFHVSIYRAPGGRMWAGIANYGVRTREGMPFAEIGAPAPVVQPAEVPAEVKTPVAVGIMNGTELARVAMSAVASLPAGTRVAGKDTADQDRVGTVYRGDDGVVSIPDHPNYGRAYVGVMWDEDPELSYFIPRTRPFVDTLSKIDEAS